MREVTPLRNLGRVPEQGRIRLGVKTERAMKALDTFRFTSADHDAICQVADIYGGVHGWISQYFPTKQKCYRKP